MQKSLLLTLLSAGVLMAGCSKKEEVRVEPLTISLGAGVITPSTKAPVVNDDTSLTCGIVGWESVGEDNYTDAPNWNTTVSVVASSTYQPVTWEEQKLYNPDHQVTTYMKSWYPAGVLEGTGVTFENQEGDVDVMMAAPVSGSAEDTDGKTLLFDHKTAQIHFKVVAGEGLAADTKLRKITIQQVQLPVGIDLTTDEILYAEAADLTVAGIEQDAITIGQEAVDAGNPVMVKPFSGNTFLVNVQTNKVAYANRLVVVDTDDVVAGTSYEVTLTFSMVGITPTAVINGWVAATGSCEVI